MKRNNLLLVLHLLFVAFISNKVYASFSYFSLTENTPLIFTDTTVAVKDDPKLLKPEKKPNLQNLKRTELDSEPKYIAIGGKLSAGYRDGGLYRYGQLTSYPNLIANQMTLTSFNIPLFDLNHGNGTGYWVTKQNGPYPEWKAVKNNVAVIGRTPLSLAKYNGPESDNFSFPEGPVFIKAMPDSYMPVYPGQRDYMPFYNRVITKEQEGKVSLWDIIDSKSADICTYETHFDTFLGLAEHPVNISTNFLFGEIDEDVSNQYIITLQKKGTKLILFTIPQVLDFPFFHIYSLNDLKKKKQDVFVRYKNNHISPIVANDATLLLPTESVQKTFLGKSSQGLAIENPFNDEDVISEDEVRELTYGIPSYNDYYVRRAAKKYNLPIVDLEAIYLSIIKNEYVTDEGISINGTYPSGDFFSSDGKTPTAIGQAIIANETIKVINKHYKTDIPLIDINTFKKTITK